MAACELCHPDKLVVDDLCTMNLNIKKQLFTWLIASLTLGLAPFVPEPHIVGKIRWVAGGAVGMTGMDWFDLVFHGFPWVFLAFFLGKAAWQFLGTKKAAQ